MDRLKVKRIAIPLLVQYHPRSKMEHIFSLPLQDALRFWQKIFRNLEEVIWLFTSAEIYNQLMANHKLESGDADLGEKLAALVTDCLGPKEIENQIRNLAKSGYTWKMPKMKLAIFPGYDREIWVVN